MAVDRRLWPGYAREIKEQIEELERKVKDLRSHLDSRIDQLRSDHITITDNQSVMNDRLDRLRSEHATMNDKLDALERKLDEVLEYVRYIKRY